ncbi:MAG: phosphoribosylaminoimidazolesuccinocarboxamide synthase [Cyclobacteriaceae bacterium]|nr:phosphoribosylaminoimidazolesuccinocarboxamide synthase [Cyclobacteriaceae bacterium]MCK5367190.1 phosphoribosylaminoimidazolesuccinocarboxamide synthase [Cyclobacteriaceae bacterium]MCK5468715.1 phosphoribosylaminoimidazolesuccinocarboxamide synthase [Cyclobacteriaceae bacterium]MCK5701622.1 phosphoribosylaminoimidazolesuccinocarboxamide synthase [Cyclobacteriaceae bacterium]
MTRPSLKETNFNLPGQLNLYRGKVRDVYSFEKSLLMVASDRISAFDVVLPKPIPYKGQILNQIASEFLNSTKHIVPNWLDSTPDPNVSVGKYCDAFQVEMVIRGYLTGHAWREYRDGKRTLCGVPMPDGLSENDKFPNPIITPTTKAHEGHDEDISREEILAQGIVSEEDYLKLEKYTRELFDFGTKVANERGLILVDTKYEFGTHQGEIFLIDEIHTPDSSRYFYKDGYEDRQEKGEKQKQLSKEFVRQWLIENGFQGKEGQQVPEMTEEIVNNISDRYVELYEKVTGNKFVAPTDQNLVERIESNIKKIL